MNSRSLGKLITKYFRAMLVGMHPTVVLKLGTMVVDGYLAESGWVRSVILNKVVGSDGEPVPWASQPFIDFLSPRLRANNVVFEFGAGASTIFYSRRVARVVAVEHDADFAAKLAPMLPNNVRLMVHPLSSDRYVEALSECVPAPEIVVVDGRQRVRCIAAALPKLVANAVIVLDDAERPAYAPAISLLGDAGYRCIEFWGLAPGGVRKKCTAVFYKAGNVLGL